MKKAANGAGTINRHKRGGWQGRLSAGKRLDGSPKRITVYGATQAIVQAKMQALRDRIAAALPLTDSRLRLSEWIDHWLT